MSMPVCEWEKKLWESVSIKYDMAADLDASGPKWMIEKRDYGCKLAVAAFWPDGEKYELQVDMPVWPRLKETVESLRAEMRIWYIRQKKTKEV